jgi:trans-aconitate methyltransferase
MFDRAKNYNEKADLQKNIAKKLCQFAAKKITLSRTVLDVGCGTGFAGKEALKLNPALIIHGVDKSQKMLEIASEFYHKTFHVLLENFVSDAKYDVAISSMCLQWCENIDEKISLLLENCKELYFAIPQPESLKELANCFLKEGIENPTLNFKIPQNLKPFHVECFEEAFPNLLAVFKSFKEIGIRNQGNTKLLTFAQLKQLEKHFNGKISWKIGFYKTTE